MNIDKYYLDIATTVAARSSCLKKHYGAVVVKNNEIISTGYNGPPRGEAHCDHCTKFGNDKDIKEYGSCPAVHAEQNAIISAARRDMIGSTLYLAGIVPNTGECIIAEPCEICLRLIKNSGIDRVVNADGTLFQRDDAGILRRVNKWGTL